MKKIILALIFATSCTIYAQEVKNHKVAVSPNGELIRIYDTLKVNDTLKHYLLINSLCDSVVHCPAIAKTSDISNHTVTFVSGTTTVGTITLNQNEDGTITFPEIPTVPANLITEGNLCAEINQLCGNVAQMDKKNTFLLKNVFSDTVIVPAGFTFGTACKNFAVNDCDLLKVFDSIQRTFADLRSEINGLRDTLNSLRGGDTPTEVADGQPCPGTETVSDKDGNSYNTVKIGNQCWLKENLKTTTSIGQTCYPGTDPTYVMEPNIESNKDNVETFGLLYNWEAAMQGSTSTNYPVEGEKVQGICPEGWHVPSKTEWDTLTYYVYNCTDPVYRCPGCDAGAGWNTDNMTNCIAKALASTSGWKTFGVENVCAVCIAQEGNNATGFSAIPAGSYDDYMGVYMFSDAARFWYATEKSSTSAYYLNMSSKWDHVQCSSDSKLKIYNSVRCVRDAGIGGTTPSEPTTMSCEKVMECMGDTLGKLNEKIETLNTTVSTQGNTIDSLAHLVDSLANLVPGGAEVADGQPCPGTETVSDKDGNSYNTVKIGNQCWLKENLKTTTSIGQTYYPGNGYGDDPMDSVNNVPTYGLLYDWEAAMQGSSSTNYPVAGEKVQGICPEGWHVPSKAEWDTLTYYVYNCTDPVYRCPDCDAGAGWEANTKCIAKALASTSNWKANDGDNACAVSEAQEGNNATGFSAIPAGQYFDMMMSNMTFGGLAYFWNATEDSKGKPYTLKLTYNGSTLQSTGQDKKDGYSVRCVRD